MNIKYLSLGFFLFFLCFLFYWGYIPIVQSYIDTSSFVFYDEGAKPLIYDSEVKISLGNDLSDIVLLDTSTFTSSDCVLSNVLVNGKSGVVQLSKNEPLLIEITCKDVFIRKRFSQSYSFLYKNAGKTSDFHFHVYGYVQ